MSFFFADLYFFPLSLLNRLKTEPRRKRLRGSHHPPQSSGELRERLRERGE